MRKRAGEEAGGGKEEKGGGKEKKEGEEWEERYGERGKGREGEGRVELSGEVEGEDEVKVGRGGGETGQVGPTGWRRCRGYRLWSRQT